MKIEEQILEAAKVITSATAALLKSALAVQREVVAQGKVNKVGCRFCRLMNMSLVWIDKLFKEL